MSVITRGRVFSDVDGYCRRSLSEVLFSTLILHNSNYFLWHYLFTAPRLRLFYLFVQWYSLDNGKELQREWLLTSSAFLNLFLKHSWNYLIDPPFMSISSKRFQTIKLTWYLSFYYSVCYLLFKNSLNIYLFCMCHFGNQTHYWSHSSVSLHSFFN